MAVTVTTVLAGQTTHVAEVEATLDGDTTATIPHGLGVAPSVVAIAPRAQVAAAVSEWAATTIDATNVVLTKGTGMGSGVAGVQVRMTAMRPHSLIA